MTTVDEILAAFGQDSVDIIRSNMARAGQNATGETSAAINYEMVNPERVQVFGPPYVYVLETGRGPYQGGPSANLKGKLETWIQAKGVNLSLGKTVEQSARSLQFLINKYGTKLWREGGRKDIITPIFDDNRINELNRKIALVELDKISNVIDANTNN